MRFIRPAPAGSGPAAGVGLGSPPAGPARNRGGDFPPDVKWVGGLRDPRAIMGDRDTGPRSSRHHLLWRPATATGDRLDAQPIGQPFRPVPPPDGRPPWNERRTAVNFASSCSDRTLDRHRRRRSDSVPTEFPPLVEVAPQRVVAPHPTPHASPPRLTCRPCASLSRCPTRDLGFPVQTDRPV